MTAEKPLTESRFLAILKKAGIPTEESIRKIVEDAVHNQLTEFHHNMIVPAINELREEMKFGFAKLERYHRTNKKNLP